MYLTGGLAAESARFRLASLVVDDANVGDHKRFESHPLYGVPDTSTPLSTGFR